jgi:hypothetical protein
LPKPRFQALHRYALPLRQIDLLRGITGEIIEFDRGAVATGDQFESVPPNRQLSSGLGVGGNIPRVLVIECDRDNQGRRRASFQSLAGHPVGNRHTGRFQNRFPSNRIAASRNIISLAAETATGIATINLGSPYQGGDYGHDFRSAQACK